ncbi:hypothetical protein [uncultured Rubinisphaera sp.]|mgnify:FL=1|uniref:hypothetical protein n=1 Tax=uncultured Rubinisphaera sp. TaxID=1678686 RepID=UPI0030DACB54|tara:strand:+ start:11680 stop:12057 length:378 start_codon:yes stop_codon:yes gene_type:complete
MIIKLFLALVGLLYGVLAIYCSVNSAKASRTVHLTMDGPGGRSEFMTVYGGLEFAIALLFLLPLAYPQYLRAGLLSCLIIHACLVAFRTLSFVLDSRAFAETRSLAIGEWVIFLLSVVMVFVIKK